MDDSELIVTPMIHGSTLEMHESSPTQHSDLAKDTTRLRLFQKAEVVLFRQRSLVCISLCLCVTLLHRAQCPGLPQFLHVLVSVELVLVVLVVRFPLWCWFLPLPFFLPFSRESTCILSSSALVPFPDDAVGFAESFERSNTTATGLHEELCCWHMDPTADCF